MITAPSLNPGKLDRRITLRYPFRSRGNDGAEVITWVEGATVFASWLGQGTRELMAAQTRNSETTGLFRIRYHSDVAAAWQLLKGNDLFEITGDPVELGRAEYLDLPVRALNEATGTASPARLMHDGTLRLLHDGTLRLLHPATTDRILLHDGSARVLHDGSRIDLHAA